MANLWQMFLARVCEFLAIDELDEHGWINLQPFITIYSHVWHFCGNFNGEWTVGEGTKIIIIREIWQHRGNMDRWDQTKLFLEKNKAYFTTSLQNVGFLQSWTASSDHRKKSNGIIY